MRRRCRLAVGWCVRRGAGIAGMRGCILRSWRSSSVGSVLAFERNEEVDADHPAVLDCPGGFVPVEDNLTMNEGVRTVPESRT